MCKLCCRDVFIDYWSDQLHCMSRRFVLRRHRHICSNGDMLSRHLLDRLIYYLFKLLIWDICTFFFFNFMHCMSLGLVLRNDGSFGSFG